MTPPQGQPGADAAAEETTIEFMEQVAVPQAESDGANDDDLPLMLADGDWTYTHTLPCRMITVEMRSTA